MDEKVVSLKGDPLPAETEYDSGLLNLLEQAITELKQGHVIGLAILAINKPDEENFNITCVWQGPRLSLLAAAARLSSRINMSLDKDTEDFT